MKCAPAQCSPNAVRMIMGFHNLSQFFDLDLTVNEFWYFFDIGHIDGVGQLRSHHRLFDNSSKGDHDRTNETLEISEEWESDYSPELHVVLGIPSEYQISDEEKPKITSAAREGSSTAPKFVIDLTSSKNEKERFAGSVLVVLAVSKATSSITDRITQRRSSSVHSVLEFVSKRPSEAKSSLPLEKLAIIKSDKVSLSAKVVPKLIPYAA
ncbi:hypothetical protein TB2_007779 [Malus domestica]